MNRALSATMLAACCRAVGIDFKEELCDAVVVIADAAAVHLEDIAKLQPASIFVRDDDEIRAQLPRGERCAGDTLAIVLLRDYCHDLSLVPGNVIRSGREDGVRIWLPRVGGRYR